MCTLTIIRGDHSFDIFMNRDERHERVQELSPAHHWDDNILAPLDPQSNGTWIAVNTKTKNWGALLNGYTEYMPNGEIQSRGEILLRLLNGENPFDDLQKLDCTPYMSFKLVLNARLFYWDGITLKEGGFHAANKTVQFQTSSSYKQDEVIEVRKQIFSDWIKGGMKRDKNDLPIHHLNNVPNKKTGILMYRDDSRTKSITHLRVDGTSSVMNHYFIDHE